MGPLVELILIILLALGVWIAVKFHQQRQEQKLRENPPPKRMLEGSLPYGIADSNERMRRFYRKSASAAADDPKLRKTGVRQLDVAYLAEIPNGALQPEIRFLVYSDPDQMDKVKRAIKQAFDGQIQIDEPKFDPLAEIASELRPPKPSDSEDTDNGAGLDGVSLDEELGPDGNEDIGVQHGHAPASSVVYEEDPYGDADIDADNAKAEGRGSTQADPDHETWQDEEF